MSRNILLGIGLLTGFLFVSSFLSIYVSDLINKGDVCGCFIPVPIMILLLSSLGVFVGSFVSYFLIGKIKKEERSYKEFVSKVKKFIDKVLDMDERKVMSELIEKKEVNQSYFNKLFDGNRVKAYRIIKKLEDKGLVERVKNGKVVKIKIRKEFNWLEK